MSDPRAFVDACLGGPPRRITDADIPDLTRTPELRDQLARVVEASQLLAEIDDARERVRVALRRQIVEWNRLNLAEIARHRRIIFDA
jgi:hypothetical protein